VSVKINDRSGGFWIEGMRKGFDMVIKDDLIPKSTVARLIGKELVNSVRGGNKHKITATYKNGRASYHFFTNGSYPYGIAKHKSPDGSPYAPLSDETIRHRKWKAKEGKLDVARDRRYILRETGEHIYDGMTVSLPIIQRGQTRIEVRFNDPKIARIHNEGRASYSSPWFKTTKTSRIPARPFIGFQDEFVRNFHYILKQL